ncbi:Switch 2 (Protein CHROMATIN REMODELING 9) (AtCHR9), partial [Durusdinium trenchii]
MLTDSSDSDDDDARRSSFVRKQYHSRLREPGDTASCAVARGDSTRRLLDRLTGRTGTALPRRSPEGRHGGRGDRRGGSDSDSDSDKEAAATRPSKRPRPSRSGNGDETEDRNTRSGAGNFKGGVGDSGDRDRDRDGGWPKLKRSQIKFDSGTNANPVTLSDKLGWQIPGRLSRHLAPYQVRGVEWIAKRLELNLGCILNDSMGLGKTIQTSVLVAAIMGKTARREDEDVVRARQRAVINASHAKQGSKDSEVDRDKFPYPVLVVCPRAVHKQWQDELQAWGCFLIMSVSANRQDEADLVKDIARGLPEVLLMTYDEVQKHIDSLRSASWSCIVLDECHILKNAGTSRFQAIQKIQCTRKVGLTGTALQNNMRELYNLVLLVRPNSIGEWAAFREFYVKPINEGLKASAQRPAKDLGRERSAQLVRMLRKIILRRDKSELKASMPRKISSVVFCQMSDIQAQAYKRVLELEETVLLRRKDEPCNCGRDKPRGKCCHSTAPDGPLWQLYHPEGMPCPRCPSCLVLPIVTILTKIANHPRLLTENSSALYKGGSGAGKQDDRASAGAGVPFGNALRDALSQEEGLTGVDADAGSVSGKREGGNGENGEGKASSQWAREALLRKILGQHFELVLSNTLRDASDSRLSGKLRVLGKKLQSWTSRRQRSNKVLIFSQSTRMLDILGSFCQAQAVRHARYDGEMSRTRREEALQRFNDKPEIQVLLISTRAGGLGLNLTVANKVVIFDPMWNPTFDRQAQDRAYRMGQERDVTVLRLFSRHTLEHRIFESQERKQKLSETVQRSARANVALDVAKPSSGATVENELPKWFEWVDDLGVAQDGDAEELDVHEQEQQPGLEHDGKGKEDDRGDSQGSIAA